MKGPKWGQEVTEIGNGSKKDGNLSYLGKKGVAFFPTFLLSFSILKRKRKR
jgi:hypothetical protein